MSVYEIDINKSIWEFLPPKKRKPKREALIQLYLHHLESLNKELILFIDEIRERVQMSCETIQLEWFLNNKFDPDFESNYPSNKKIIISNKEVSADEEYSFKEEEQIDEVYAYTKAEDSQAYSSPYFTHMKGDFTNLNNATISISNDLIISDDDLIRVRGLVNRYAFLGKKFNIIRH